MKDDIQKVINLNEYIAELSNEFEVLTYAGVSWVYSCPMYDKMHTLLYHDYNIHMFVQENKYCFITAKGNIYAYSNLNIFKKRLYMYLDRIYYISYVIQDIKNMIACGTLHISYGENKPIWL